MSLQYEPYSTVIIYNPQQKLLLIMPWEVMLAKLGYTSLCFETKTLV